VNPALKRFTRDFGPLADAIARVDIGQTNRDLVAAAATDALTHMPNFKPALFRLLASDPLVPCAGTDDGPCADGLEIRVGMHLNTAPDGRAQSWQEELPVVRCLACVIANFVTA
jgi:hypothetical protein